MALSDLLAAVRTQVLPAADRDGLLRAAAGLLACQQAGADELYASLQQREIMGSTAIGHGIAIPHGRMAKLYEPRGALLRLEPAVDFQASDGQPVDLVFAIAVPQHYTHQHLMLLSELAERFSDPRFRDALRSAPDAAALQALLGDNAVPALLAGSA